MFEKHLHTWKFPGSYPYLLFSGLGVSAASFFPVPSTWESVARSFSSMWGSPQEELLGCVCRAAYQGPDRVAQMSNICFLPVLKVRSPRSKFCRVWFLLRTLAGLQPGLCPHVAFPLSALDYLRPVPPARAPSSGPLCRTSQRRPQIGQPSAPRGRACCCHSAFRPSS